MSHTTSTPSLRSISALMAREAAQFDYALEHRYAEELRAARVQPSAFGWKAEEPGCREERWTVLVDERALLVSVGTDCMGRWMWHVQGPGALHLHVRARHRDGGVYGACDAIATLGSLAA